jgi:transcriptional regulator
MYTPKLFAVEDRAQQLQFMRDYGFATLVSLGGHGPTATHLPLAVEERDDGSVFLMGHVARANPHWKDLESGTEALAIFHGPHAYISPTWYEMHPSVPTWNYAAVHAYGKAKLLDAAATRRLLNTLSDQYESGREKPWRMEDLTIDYVEKMVAAIVGFEIAIERIEGKFKLSQNRPAADRAGVVNGLLQGAPADLQVARLMQQVEKRS